MPCPPASLPPTGWGDLRGESRIQYPLRCAALRALCALSFSSVILKPFRWLKDLSSAFVGPQFIVADSPLRSPRGVCDPAQRDLFAAASAPHSPLLRLSFRTPRLRGSPEPLGSPSFLSSLKPVLGLKDLSSASVGPQFIVADFPLSSPRGVCDPAENDLSAAASAPALPPSSRLSFWTPRLRGRPEPLGSPSFLSSLKPVLGLKDLSSSFLPQQRHFPDRSPFPRFRQHEVDSRAPLPRIEVIGVLARERRKNFPPHLLPQQIDHRKCHLT